VFIARANSNLLVSNSCTLLLLKITSYDAKLVCNFVTYCKKVTPALCLFNSLEDRHIVCMCLRVCVM
jgi:hypothetical protein